MKKNLPKKLLENEIKIVKNILDNISNLKNFEFLCEKSLQVIKKNKKLYFWKWRQCGGFNI